MNYDTALQKVKLAIMELKESIESCEFRTDSDALRDIDEILVDLRLKER